MDQEPQTKEDLTDEFRALGQNLVKSLNALWQSPERKRLQEEIEAGVNTLIATIKAEAATFSQSPTGQRLKADLDDLQQSVQNSEVEARVRQELLKALRTVNAELKKVSNAWTEKASPPEREEKG